MAYFIPARAVASLAATSIATLMISSALAQTPPAAPAAPQQRPATPQQRPAAGAPAKPAQPAQAQPATPVQPGQPGQPGQQADAPAPQLIYSQWLKFCVGPDGQPADQKDAAAKAKQVCMTGIDVRLESGQPIVAMVAFDPPAENPKIMRITLPVGMQLQHGTRIVIDQGQPLTAPYVTCFANGCMADYPLDAATMDKFKKGKSAAVQGINFNGSAISVPVPLQEFAKIFEGAPADPKVLEQQQKKLEDELKKKGEELQKKADEARKKLEQGGAAKPQ